MIYLDGMRPPVPDRFDENVKASKDKIQDLIDAGESPKSDDFNNEWSGFKKIFIQAQHNGKCAYCETRFRAAYPGDIDHFRPKARVVEYDKRGYRREDYPPERKEKTKTASGYWWLAYEWGNWILSCDRCNKWKGMQFPTQPRLDKIKKGGESKVTALLLNPFDEDPAPHLTFNVLGEIHPVNGSEKGKHSIDVFGLDREYLRRERENAAKGILRLSEDLFASQNNELAYMQTVKRLLDECEADNAYAGMIRYLVGELTGMPYEQWVECFG